MRSLAYAGAPDPDDRLCRARLPHGMGGRTLTCSAQQHGYI